MADPLGNELDNEHVLALIGLPVHSEDGACSTPFANELTASIHVGELEAEANAGGANELRAATP